MNICEEYWVLGFRIYGDAGHAEFWGASCSLQRVWSSEENAGRVQQVEFYLVLLLNLFNALFDTQFGGGLLDLLNLLTRRSSATLCDCLGW